MTPPIQSNVEALLERWRERSDHLSPRQRQWELDRCITELEAALKADKESLGKAMAWPSRNYPE